jgi:hypothetical protein
MTTDLLNLVLQEGVAHDATKIVEVTVSIGSHSRRINSCDGRG